MKISSVELTLLDLLRYPQASAGLDNILTVFSDLGPKLNPESMATLAHAFGRSVVQRAGYLLDMSGFANHAEKLHALIRRPLATSRGSSLTRRCRPIPILRPRFKLATSAGM